MEDENDTSEEQPALKNNGTFIHIMHVINYIRMVHYSEVSILNQ